MADSGECTKIRQSRKSGRPTVGSRPSSPSSGLQYALDPGSHVPTTPTPSQGTRCRSRFPERAQRFPLLPRQSTASPALASLTFHSSSSRSSCELTSSELHLQQDLHARRISSSATASVAASLSQVRAARPVQRNQAPVPRSAGRPRADRCRGRTNLRLASRQISAGRSSGPQPDHPSHPRRPLLPGHRPHPDPHRAHRGLQRPQQRRPAGGCRLPTHPLRQVPDLVDPPRTCSTPRHTVDQRLRADHIDTAPRPTLPTRPRHHQPHELDNRNGAPFALTIGRRLRSGWAPGQVVRPSADVRRAALSPRAAGPVAVAVASAAAAVPSRSAAGSSPDRPHRVTALAMPELLTLRRTTRHGATAPGIPVHGASELGASELGASELGASTQPANAPSESASTGLASGFGVPTMIRPAGSPAVAAPVETRIIGAARPAVPPHRVSSSNPAAGHGSGSDTSPGPHSGPTRAPTQAAARGGQRPREREQQRRQPAPHRWLASTRSSDAPPPRRPSPRGSPWRRHESACTPPYPRAELRRTAAPPAPAPRSEGRHRAPPLPGDPWSERPPISSMPRPMPSYAASTPREGAR